MKTDFILDKLRASGLHITLNLIIFFVLLYLLRFLWYPSPYFIASGGLQGLKIVALVDVVLGPLLTFVIFNKRKPPHLLKLDVTVILILQILAFTWGIWTIYMQRPVAVTFWDDGFFTVSARALSEQKDYRLILNTLGDDQPVYAYVDRPITGDDASKLRATIKEHNNIPPFHIVSLYLSHTNNLSAIEEKKVPIEKLLIYLSKNANANQKVQQLLKKHKVEMEDIIPVKLNSKYQNMLIVLDSNGNILGFIKHHLMNTQ